MDIEKAAIIQVEDNTIQLNEAAAKKVEDSIDETLTFMDFPSQYWSDNCRQLSG